MGNLLTKTTVVAIEEEASGLFGSGPTRDHIVTDTVPSGFATDYDITLTINSGVTNGVVSEPTIRVYLDNATSGTSGAVDSYDTLLVKGTDYSVATTTGTTVVTLLTSGTTLSGGENIVIDYGVFEDSDVILLDTGSFIDVAIEELTKDTANGQLTSCESVAGQESTSATFTFDFSMIPLASQPAGAAGQLKNHKLIKNALGFYALKGANVNKTAKTIAEVTAGTGTYDLYRFRLVTEAQTSLAARQYLGASTNACEDSFGVMSEGITLNMNTAGLAKADIPIQGINFYSISSDYGTPTVLSGTGCSAGSFVVKNSTFTFYGTDVDVNNLVFNPSNTLRDSNSGQSTGIYLKTITEKMFEGTFDIEVEDATILNNFKNNTAGAVYFELANSDGDEIILYIPNVRVTAVGKSDDAGVIVQGTTYKAFPDSNSNVFYLATKAA